MLFPASIAPASPHISVFSGGGWTDPVTVPGRLGPESDRDVAHNIVGSQYLKTMGMPIVLGRELGPQDTAASRKVAIINETMARAYFGGMSPLGRTFGVGGGPGAQRAAPQWQDIEVVGVVKDAKYMTLDEKQMPAAFLPPSPAPRHVPLQLCRPLRWRSETDCPGNWGSCSSSGCQSPCR